MAKTRTWFGAAVLAVAGASAAATVIAAPAGADTAITVSSTGSVKVTYSGNGHGHGLSQYGARGAAIAGLSYSQILGFYYPGTTLARLSGEPFIRVLLSGTGTTTTVAAYSELVVTGVAGVLPMTGVLRYRLIADSGAGLTLQKLGSASGSTWQTVKTGLPNKASFSRLNNISLQLYRSDGTSTRYYGYLTAVRASATGTTGGVRTVNRVTYDKYAMGVTPREMPASWQHAGVQAQAVAARTYGDYEVHHPASSYYDICDTSSCQVYGGHEHYDSHGNTLWTDDQPVAEETTNLVLHYQGAPVFAQYSASNGGWTVSGGQPYLPAKADGYDSSKSGDPYLNATKTVSVATLAKYFGLAKATKFAITKRDGHGSWGGRVLAGYVSGTTSTGAAKTVTFDGFGLQAALGLGTTLLLVQAA